MQVLKIFMIQDADLEKFHDSRCRSIGGYWVMQSVSVLDTSNARVLQKVKVASKQLLRVESNRARLHARTMHKLWKANYVPSPAK